MFEDVNLQATGVEVGIRGCGSGSEIVLTEGWKISLTRVRVIVGVD